MRKALLALAIAGALSACAAPKSPQQSVFSAKAAYEATLSAAVAYKRLPLCAEPPVQPCSRKGVVAQLQKADDVASKSLDAAENAVRTPGFGESVVQSAIAAARAALDAFVAVVNSLGGK